jgi:hypothetical protein
MSIMKECSFVFSVLNDYNKQNSYRLKHLHKISVKNIADATKTKCH